MQFRINNYLIDQPSNFAIGKICTASFDCNRRQSKIYKLAFNMRELSVVLSLKSRFEWLVNVILNHKLANDISVTSQYSQDSGNF